TQELTAPELNFLKQAITLCPRITCVISKKDLQHHWREIVEANTEHLTAAGIDIPIMVTSSLLHELAKQETDESLRKESHIDALAAHMQENVRGDVLAARHRAVVDDICSVGEHLAMVVESELQVLGDADGGAGVVLNLQQAEEVAGKLVQRSARWQQTLSDGAGELGSDI